VKLLIVDDLPAVATATHGEIVIARLPAGMLTQKIWNKIWDAYFTKGSGLTLEESIAIYETEEK